MASLLGINPWQVLSLRDPVDQLVMRQLIVRANDIARQRAKQGAEMTAVLLCHMLFGGRRG